MSTPIPTFFYTLTLDKNHQSELCFLSLFEDPSTCGTVGPGPITVCKLWGELNTTSSESFRVRGSKIPIDADSAYVTIEFRFRNVRIIATGILIRSNLFTRFFAFRPGAIAEPLISPVASTQDDAAAPLVRINPADGDTGTGTGTQTLVNPTSTEGAEGKAESD